MSDEGWLGTEEVLRALHELRVAAGRAVADDVLWVGDPGSTRPVVALSAPTPAQISHIVGSTWGEPGIALADRLGPPQRARLEEAGWGWVDRRGEARVDVAGISVQAAVTSLQASATSRPDPLERPASRAVLLRLLRTPDDVPSVRALAGEVDLSVGAVGRALADLREEGLVVDRRCVTPSAFHRLAVTWRPVWRPIAVAPVDLAPADVRLLGLRIEDPQARGWASVGHHAARAMGLDLPEDRTPLRVLVPDERALVWAERLLGVVTDDAVPALEVAVTPVDTALDGRREWTRTRRRPPIPLASPVVVAWSLANDTTAAAEGWLEAFEPDGATGEPRVW